MAWKLSTAAIGTPKGGCHVVPNYKEGEREGRMPGTKQSRRHGRRPSMTHATKVPCTQAREAHMRLESLPGSAERCAAEHAGLPRREATTAAVAPREAAAVHVETWTLKVTL